MGKLIPTEMLKRKHNTEKGRDNLYFLPGSWTVAQIDRDKVKAEDVRGLQGETQQWTGLADDVTCRSGAEFCSHMNPLTSNG